MKQIALVVNALFCCYRDKNRARHVHSTCCAGGPRGHARRVYDEKSAGTVWRANIKPVAMDKENK